MSEQPNAQKIKTMRDSISHAVSDSSRKASSKNRSELHQKLAADLLEQGKAVAPCNSKVAHRRTASVPLPAAGGTPKPQIGNLINGAFIPHLDISGRKSGTHLTSSCSSAEQQSQQNQVAYVGTIDTTQMARYVPLYANLISYRYMECMREMHDEFRRHITVGNPLYNAQCKAEDKRAYFRTRFQAIAAIYDNELGAFNRAIPETIEAILDSYGFVWTESDQKEEAEVAPAQIPVGCCTIL